MSNPWLRILYDFELYGRPKEEKEGEPEPSQVVYFHPSWPEAVLVQPALLRRSIHQHKYFLEVLKDVASKGGILYFRGQSRFNGDGMLVRCPKYNQTVHPSICISRITTWPRRIYSHEDATAEKDRLTEELQSATDPAERRRLVKQIRKFSDSYDPYPLCRQCKIGDRFMNEACMGVEYNPLDERCKKCDDMIECCHLMRARLLKIVEGRKEEVIEELVRANQIKTDEQIRKEYIMAKKKEEVVVDKKAAKRREKKLNADPEINSLLKAYVVATGPEKSNIRSKLRKKGYYMSKIKGA